MSDYDINLSRVNYNKPDNPPENPPTQTRVNPNSVINPSGQIVGQDCAWTSGQLTFNSQPSAAKEETNASQNELLDLDTQVINDIANAGLEDVENDSNFKSLQAALDNHTYEYKELKAMIKKIQKGYAKGSPQWENLNVLMDKLETAEKLKHTSQHYAVGYNQDTKQNNKIDMNYFDQFIAENADKLNDYGYTKDSDVNARISEMEAEISMLNKSEQINLCVEIRQKYGKKSQMLVSKWFSKDVVDAAKKKDINYNKTVAPNFDQSCSPDSGTREAWFLYSSSGNPIKG